MDELIDFEVPRFCAQVSCRSPLSRDYTEEKDLWSVGIWKICMLCRICGRRYKIDIPAVLIPKKKERPLEPVPVNLPLAADPVFCDVCEKQIDEFIDLAQKRHVGECSRIARQRFLYATRNTKAGRMPYICQGCHTVTWRKVPTLACNKVCSGLAFMAGADVPVPAPMPPEISAEAPHM